MTVVVGETDDPALPAECCDALLLRYVVHHMADADAMFAGIGQALRAGGRVLVIEKTEPGDGIEATELIETARTAGFEVISRHDEWGAHDGHYAVLLHVARSPR
jgi:ubiquinone/menaquinone biosynthesis C-methylase UbiE